MKLLLREYLASLKERDELDAILPDMLSEMGFHVYSRPGRGTNQYGVDIAAVGPDADGETKLFLLSVKRGDLTRQEWSAGEQGLRASLDDILDVYIRSHVPPLYAELKIVICLCFGGVVRETVRERLSAYTQQRTSHRISFQEWDGDKIAGMLATGILSEQVLPRALRSSFQKAVALVDEPDIAFEHFARLLQQLHAAGQGPAARVRSARQIYLCQWILYVWARDADNLEAAYRGSERGLMVLWDLFKAVEPGGSEEDAIDSVFRSMVSLHMSIGETYLNARILPHVAVRHGLSMAVGTNNPVDINLKLFEVLGRLAQSALWIAWLKGQPNLPEDAVAVAEARIQKLYHAALALIEANPTLYLPVADYQATEIVSTFMLFMAAGADSSSVHSWFAAMSDRLIYATRLHRRYTTCFTEYRDLVEHPRLRTEAYRQEATAGSTLIPVLAAWFAKVGDLKRLGQLSKLTEKELKHCTLQLWLPDETSETHLYRNTDQHGRALCDLRVTSDGQALSRIIDQAIRDNVVDLTADRHCWPLLVLACRHWRLPIPPHCWFSSLRLEPSPSGVPVAEPTAG